MARWRGQAIEIFPMHKKMISKASSVMSLWSDLRILFEQAVAENETETIEQVRKYMDYSLKSQNQELLTAVACAFIEHLPEHPQTRKFIPLWFSKAEFLEMKELFGYHSNAEDFEAILKMYK